MSRESTTGSDGADGTGSARTAPRQKGPDEVFCSSCGEVISQQAEVCPHCGVRRGGPPASKSPLLAALLSVVLVGAGQAYNGQWLRGLAWFGATALAGFLLGVLGFLTLGVGLVLAPLLGLFPVAAAVDAYLQAKKINAGKVAP